MSLEQKISKWISKYLKNNKLQSLVIGISGGIDSAVTSTLCNDWFKNLCCYYAYSSKV